jgi:hypothetical protein
LRRPGRSRGGARGDPAIGAGGQVGVPLNAASSLRGDDREWPEWGTLTRSVARAERPVSVHLADPRRSEREREGCAEADFDARTTLAGVSAPAACHTNVRLSRSPTA